MTHDLRGAAVILGLLILLAGVAVGGVYQTTPLKRDATIWAVTNRYTGADMALHGV